MNDSDKIQMFLNIGDQRISINVPFERQEFVRDVEGRIEHLYRKWRHSFTSKTDREILAMVAYQFASHFCELKQRYDTAIAKADECLRHTYGNGNQAESEDFEPEDL